MKFTVEYMQNEATEQMYMQSEGREGCLRCEIWGKVHVSCGAASLRWTKGAVGDTLWDGMGR